jgi:hypothetical protein
LVLTGFHGGVAQIPQSRSHLRSQAYRIIC